jgi:hypothetical protein
LFHARLLGDTWAVEDVMDTSTNPAASAPTSADDVALARARADVECLTSVVRLLIDDATVEVVADAIRQIEAAEARARVAEARVQVLGAELAAARVGSATPTAAE